MRVLVLGGTGFIGSAIVAHLTSEGHQCITVSRGSNTGNRHIRLDIANATNPADWYAALHDIHAVVNAAGVLQDSVGQSAGGVHVTGVDALYAACEARGVRRVIHFSAIGVDREAPTSFSRTKRDGETALMARDLDWVILRPSVVIGRSAYGGSALLRGLAALPILPVLPDSAPIQPVHLDDVVDTVAHFLRPDVPGRQTLDLAGPRRMNFEDAVDMMRRWLRWRPAWHVPTPRPLASLLYRLGDGAYALGWHTQLRPPLSARCDVAQPAIRVPGSRPWALSPAMSRKR